MGLARIRQLGPRPPLALGFTLLVLVLAMPWRQTMPGIGLDPSWTMVLAYAFEHGWQFGADISFTYGPLGPLGVAAFFPGIYGLSLLYWLFFLTATAVGICLLCRGAGAVRWALIAVAAVLTCVGWVHDAHVFTATFILFLLCRSPDPRSVIVAAILVILLALAAHMKMTYAMLALPVIVTADMARAVGLRAKPVLTLLYLVTYLAVYVAIGQAPSELWSYITGASEIARGYNEVMFTYGRPGEILAYCALVAISAAAIGWVEWRGGERYGRVNAVLAMAAFGMIAVIAGKAGFTRHDDAHAVIAWMTLALSLPIYIGALEWRDRRGPYMLCAFVATVSVAALIASYLAARPVRDEQPAAYLARIFGNHFIENAATIRDVAFGDGYAEMVRAYHAAIDEIRAQSPLPAFSGTTDILGNQQAILLAHGAVYRPRPIFQSYTVYTSELIRRNIAFLDSDRAPQTILFKFSYIDGRFPALDEGALLPTLLRRYDIANIEHGYAVMVRRATPRTVTLDPLADATVKFGEKLDVSAWSEDLLWVEIDFHPTVLGKIRRTLMKPPMVTLTVDGTDQLSTGYRILPSISGDGFLLSPVMFAPEHLQRSPQEQTRVVRLSLNQDRADALDFEDEISVRLKKLRVASE